MQMQMHGLVDGPVVAVLSTWDPFLGSHARLLDRLQAHAGASGLQAVAVLLDPAPALLLNGAQRWPVYHDAATRVCFLQSSGIGAVARINFVAADLGDTAAGFFALLRRQMTIAEFWLRDGQTIGSGPRGNATAIHVDCLRHKARLERLPADDTQLQCSLARQQLAAGAVARAATGVGRPPIVSRPRSRQASVAWREGRYLAQALASPLDVPSQRGTLSVRLTKRSDGMCHFAWPDPQVEYLTFLAGPGDDSRVRSALDRVRSRRRHAAPASRLHLAEADR